MKETPVKDGIWSHIVAIGILLLILLGLSWLRIKWQGVDLSPPTSHTIEGPLVLPYFR